MAAMTTYGEWHDFSGDMTLRPDDVVINTVGEWADDYDMEGLTRAYVEAINEALPEDVVLSGRFIFGPYPPRTGLPAWELGVEAKIREAIAGVDLTPLLERFERKAES